MTAVEHTYSIDELSAWIAELRAQQNEIVRRHMRAMKRECAPIQKTWSAVGAELRRLEYLDALGADA